MIHNSLTDMTVTANVSDAKKQAVAQYSLITSYSGMVVGMLVGTGLAVLTDNSIGANRGDVGALLLMLPTSARLNRVWQSSPIGAIELILGPLGVLLDGSAYHTA